MAKQKNTVIVWWVEAGTGELRCHQFNSLPNNGSYEAEVMIKYAVDPLQITTIRPERSGNDWEVAALQNLELLAENTKSALAKER